MRFICLDIGDKRTGIASGDTETRLAGPLTVVNATSRAQMVDAIVRTIRAENTKQIVIGLPLNMDGSEGPRTAMVRAVADEIHRHLSSCTIHFHDERLSTFDADQKMARIGLTHGQKKARRDALAATAILQDFLDLSDS